MCDTCLLENVKSSMLSRRSLFKSSAAAAAATIAAVSTTAQVALAQSSGKIIDLSHTYDDTFPTFAGTPGITGEKVVDFKKDGFTIYKLTIFEHTSTHIDAPLHFTEAGTSVADLAPESLMCPLRVLDISAKAKAKAKAGAGGPARIMAVV